MATVFIAITLLPALGGCSTIGYYSQLASGEISLLAKRRSVEKVIADPSTSPELRERLKLASKARGFASDHLDLPRNGSYTFYADVGRPYVVWNVWATPAYSLRAVEHCFPIAGCVAYRGYYAKADAEAAAAASAAAGDDTSVDGVAAFSTLGWFDDPILNTMLRWSDDDLIGTIFHELAHQKVYVKDDTAFNESYATFVQTEGLAQWRRELGQPSKPDLDERRDDQFTALMLAARERLEKLYASGQPEAVMQAGKAAEFDRLRADYRSLRDGRWGGYSGYDTYMNGPLNNAKLLPFGLYHRWVAAFSGIYADAGNWPAFFATVKKLGALPAAEREAELKKHMPADAAEAADLPAPNPTTSAAGDAAP